MSTQSNESKLLSDKPILMFSKRPFGISAPGCNTTNYIDEEFFILLKMNHQTISYFDQKINGKQKKVVGTVTVTTHLVQNKRVSKSVRFHAKIVRNLGCDAQANEKLWKKCGMDISTEKKFTVSPPESKQKDSPPESKYLAPETIDHAPDPKNIEENTLIFECTGYDTDDYIETYNKY